MNKNYNFGYTKVNSKQKTKLVQDVFSSVASNYDIMNDLLIIDSIQNIWVGAEYWQQEEAWKWKNSYS